MKLTFAQQKVLNIVKALGVYQCAEGYRPARRLIELGLVDSAPLPTGQMVLKPRAPTATEGES